MQKIQGRYITLEESEHSLTIRLDKSIGEVREEVILNDKGQVKSADVIWAELIEDIRCNSGIEILAPEQIGALTSCHLIIGMDVSIDDNGDVTETGNVYWFSDYQVRDDIAELAEYGYIVLQKAGES